MLSLMISSYVLLGSVRFRAIITQLVDLKPYTDPVTIYILVSRLLSFSVY